MKRYLRIGWRGNFALTLARSLLLGVLAIGSAQAGIYRWVDEQGNTHFGDRPAATDAAEEVVVDAGRPWQGFDIEVRFDGESDWTAAEQQSIHQQLQQDVNRVYQFYDRVLYFDFYRTVPVSIRYFSERASYVAYLDALDVDYARRSLGMFLPGSNEIVVFSQSTVEATFATIRHETSHAILDSLALVPRWLNEGVAEQMETLDQEGDALVIHAHGQNRYAVSRADRQARDVLTLVEQDGASFHRQLASGPSQAVAGQLVYQLLSTRWGRGFLTQLLQAYKRGEQRRAYYLLDELYIGGRSTFQTHWTHWLNNGMATPERIRLD